MNLKEYIAGELEKLRYMNNIDRFKDINSLYDELEKTGHKREEISQLITEIIKENLQNAFKSLEEDIREL